MHPAHPSPPLCFNVFLSFYLPGTSIPTTLFQRVPVILCTRHIHPHHSVSTCSCHSMHPAHPSPPLCFNVFLSFYAPGTSIPATLFQRIHFPCLNSYTGFQLITESNVNCPLLHIVLLQYINHLILQVSCTFLTSPDNSDHLPHSSFLFPELN